VTADILSGKETSNAVGILQKYFGEGTELGKEHKIYKFINEEKIKNDTNAEKAIEVCIRAKKKLNENKLNKEKFELIKEIKGNWDIDSFLKGSITNYKLMASIYKTLEESIKVDFDIDPKESYQSRQFILEHLTTTKKKVLESTDKDDLIKLYQEQSEDMRLLSYKLMVDNFNTKYSTLNDPQKSLIKEYIYNVSNTNSLRKFINDEVPKVRVKLNELSGNINNQILKIKIKEAANQLSKICEGAVVKDNHVSSLLVAYELIKEMESLNGK
jgi:hypothetical protein